MTGSYMTPEAPLEIRQWFGYMTVHNAAAICARIDKMLRGRRYTWVAVNENLDLLEPEVRTGQYLVDAGTRDGNAISFTSEREDGRPYAHISVHDTYGVWGISTSLEEQPKRTKVGHHHAADPELKGRGELGHVYVAFGDGYRGEVVVIKQRTMDGGRITWKIAVESPVEPTITMGEGEEVELRRRPDGDYGGTWPSGCGGADFKVSTKP